MQKYRDIYIRIMLTILLTWIYCMIWTALEFIIDGVIMNTLVDNIIMVLFIPTIYISTKSFI